MRLPRSARNRNQTQQSNAILETIRSRSPTITPLERAASSLSLSLHLNLGFSKSPIAPMLITSTGNDGNAMSPPPPPSALSAGHSASSSGSAGSPSTEPTAASTPAASDKAAIQLEIGTNEGKASGKKKRRAPRAIASDNSGRGLRQYSMRVCEKVESKGRTTYNEVADELVAEITEPNNNLTAPDLDEEKNIRRRIYDALNVLMAMDIISKDKKEIQWKGLPRAGQNDIEELKAERIRLRNKIQKKTPYLRELSNQLSGLQQLKQRNQQLYGSGNAPGGVALPFILVQTRSQATVEVEISEDMQLVHFDFNSTPFELHDDSYVLEAMRYYGSGHNEGAHERISNGQDSSSVPVGVNQQVIPLLMSRPPTTPPLPGIIKASRAKRPRF